MSKAIVGAVEIAGAVALGAIAIGTGGLGTAALAAYLNTTQGFSLMVGLAASGISAEAGAIASAISGGRGVNITDRRPASNRQIITGTQMVGGVLVYESVSGHQYNQVIAIATHSIHSISGVYLDGRKIYFKGSGNGWSVRNGVGFGGDADNNDHFGPDGVTKYNFGGKVYCEARYGDQAFGDYMTSLHGNDPAWGPKNGDCPTGVGVAYIYLKCTAGDQFPQRPEVRILVNGKDDIYDPRTGTTSFTNNAALVLADRITDPIFGLGDNSINQAQLVAAANICDEQVAVAALGGGTESRYCTDMVVDTGTSVSDAMETMRANMNARLSYIGGEWWIMPGAYVAPVLWFDESALTGDAYWYPGRGVRDLPNRVLATHISAEYPYSVAGGYYLNHSGTQNNFDLKFTQTSVPYYAQDVLHSYPNDQWLIEDQNHVRPLSMDFPAALSVTQCQRLMKQALLGLRVKQGSGTFEMNLGAYKLQPGDTFKMTFPELGWVNEILEVTSTSLRLERSGEGDDESLSVRYTVGVRQTDPSIYAWSTIEELNVYAAAAAPTQTPWTPNPPTNMQLVSGPATVLTQPDGSAIPTIRVTWDTPLDNLATQIDVQFMQTGSGVWYNAPSQDISLNVSLITGVVAGQTYSVRIRTARANGVTSEWVEIDNFMVSKLDTFLGTLGPIAYAGMSESIIPNGSFALGSAQGWVTVEGGVGHWAFEQPSEGARIHLFAGQQDAVASRAFSVLPGKKYRIGFQVYASAGVQDTYLRVLGSANPAANITGANYSTITDFIGAGAITPINQWVDKTYDWVCPDGVNWASLLIHNWTGNNSDIYIQRVTCVPYAGVAGWGADVTADQPIVYAGTSGNLVANGDFLKQNADGWALGNGAAFQKSIGNNSYGIGLPGNAVAISPTFGIQPGHRYRVIFSMGKTVGGDSSFMRIFWGSQFSENLNDGTSPGYMGYHDYVANAGLVFPLTDYQDDWFVAPEGAYYASLAVYNIAGGYTYLHRAVAIDFSMVAEAGADVTGSHTSDNTKNVAGVPAQVIANVVPNGFKVILNPGNRTYSIQAN